MYFADLMQSLIKNLLLTKIFNSNICSVKQSRQEQARQIKDSFLINRHAYNVLRSLIGPFEDGLLR